MAADGQPSEDRTETATQRRMDQARDAGDVPVSREFTTLISLTAVILVLVLQASSELPHSVLELRAFIDLTRDARLIRTGALHLVMPILVAFVLPGLVTALVVGSLVHLLQTRFLLRIEALGFDLSRLSPVGGLARMFGKRGLIELIKSLAKMVLFGGAMWIAFRSTLPTLLLISRQDPHLLPKALSTLLFTMLVASLIAQAIVAAIDLGWVHFQHNRKLRMTKQDIRDEMKDTEGNPHVKARVRRIRVTRARRNMMSKVSTATVIITNPTHYSVALVYDRETNPAPRVVAKGIDSVAMRIRNVALANNVPIVANPPLARALYRLDLDAEIQAEHFKAVAEIIAFVWRIRRPASSASL